MPPTPTALCAARALPRTLRVVALILASALAASSAGIPSSCSGVTEIVVGQSAGATAIELGAAEGLRTAILEASQLTTLPLRLVQYNHTTQEELLSNVKKLVEEDCAFLIAATTATSDSEPTLLANLKAYGVPLVGSMSASESLRDIANNTATFTRNYTGTAEEVTLPFVVNVRASGSDELNAVLSQVSQDWASLSRVALVAHDTPYGQWAYNYVDGSLEVLTGTSGLLSNAFLSQTNLTDTVLASSMAALFATATPKAIVLCTLPDATARVVTWLAQSSHSGIPVYAVAWTSGTALNAALDTATRALLNSKGYELYFTQEVPEPVPASLVGATPLIRKFNEAGTAYKSHSALEGYLTGWFIYEVLQQAAVRFSATVTRGDFLYTVFEDLRTFDVQGVTLGPYGDGGTDSSSTQTDDDACNQGVHEVFMTLFDPVNGTQTQLSEATLKFAGCMAPQWTSGGVLTLVGSVTLSDTTEDTE
eukprot:m51a1_g12626 hypothetical protein (479) ;mRNA; f:2025-3877